MSEEDSDTSPGERVRQLRQYRGMDQVTLAGLVGRSQAWLSRLEAGTAGPLRLVDLESLAHELQVHPDEITGKPHRSRRKPTHDVDVMVPAIRRALIDPVPDAEPVPVASLARRTDGAIRALWRTGDLSALAATLPGLLSSVRLAASDSGTEEDERGALELLAVTASVAFQVLKHCRHLDLALLSAQLCSDAAARLDDPLWSAYAGIRRSHALVPLNDPHRALVISRRAAEAVEPLIGTDETARRIYGFAHLVSGVWAAQASLSTDAEEHVSEAERAVAGLADAHVWDLFSGPTGTALHRTQVSAELGEGDRLPALVAAIDESNVDGAVQRSYLHTHLAVGLSQMRGRADDAVAELRRAEQIAPARFRTRSAVVPGLVMQLFGQRMRSASLRELRGLAYRVGIGA